MPRPSAKTSALEHFLCHDAMAFNQDINKWDTSSDTSMEGCVTTPSLPSRTLANGILQVCYAKASNQDISNPMNQRRMRRMTKQVHEISVSSEISTLKMQRSWSPTFFASIQCFTTRPLSRSLPVNESSPCMERAM